MEESMRRRIILTCLLLCLTACNLPIQTTATPLSQPFTGTPPTALTTPTAIPIETLLALPTATRFVPATATPRLALAVTNDQPVNCRYGPSTAYAVVGGLDAGRQAEVIGKSADEGWWQVRNPSDPSTECWLAASVVTVTGNQAVPVIPAPPALVTRIEIAVEPASLNVACDAFPQYVTVSAEIFVNGPTTLTWQWETSEGEVIPKDPLLYLEAGSQIVRVYYTVKAAKDYWLQAHVSSPNEAVNRGFFKATCVP
jgi:SH3-like domain-containing protein